MTGIFTVVIAPPRSADLIRKNPLGIYVQSFNWSQDLNTGETR